MTTPMLCLAAMLSLAADSPAAPVAFQFKDAAAYENRQVLQYRAIEFRDSPVQPLGDQPKFEAGSLYGLVPVGPKPETALPIVWCPKATGGPELWLDANGDGKLAGDERHPMSGRELDVPATITIQLEPEPKKVHRTLSFRRSTLGDGLRYAVRGYAQGTLDLGGTKCAALLVDGSANGSFDTVGQDRVWLDLSGDGRFDPLVEQFPLGKPIRRDRDVYVVRSDAAASAVVANLRSAGQGKLRLTLAKKTPSPAKITAELISDLGELVTLDRLDEPSPVHFGEYRLSSLKLEVADSSGQAWTYNFYNEKKRTYSLPTGGQTEIRILSELAMQVELQPEKTKVSAGQTVSIRPKLLADQSLYLSSCTIGNQADPRQAEGSAEILLLRPDGKTITRGVTGFS